MALLDHFRAQSRQKHPDAAVRLAFVQEIPIDERELVAEMAREDPDARVRATCYRTLTTSSMIPRSKASSPVSTTAISPILVRT